MRMLRRIVGMLRRPAATYDEVREERLRGSVWYLFVLFLPLACVLLALSLVIVPLFIFPQLGDRQGMGFLGIALMLPLVLVGGCVAVLLTGLLLHPFTWLLGGRRGLGKTLQAAIYGSTPLVLSLWFPPAMVATAIWSPALVVMGLQRLQELTIGRAIVAVILPLVVLLGVAAGAGFIFW